jgi:hypothetical protein
VYVGPNDLLQVLGPGPRRRVRVRARPRLSASELGTYEGTYPAVGLAARKAPPEALAPDPGQPYRVPAQTALALFELPRGELVAELPAQAASYEVRVVGEAQGWLAVRAGSGPYLIGWTSAPLQPQAAPSPAPEEPRAASANDTDGEGAMRLGDERLPVRLRDEPGALKRVAAGTKLRFGSRVIAVFKARGWARVVTRYEQAGFADVLAAVDDQVTVRGLLPTADLSEPEPASETARPAAAR